MARTYVGSFDARDDEFVRAHQYEVDRKKRVAFIAKETKLFKEFLHVKVSDCPVCLEEFKETDKIV
jgi:hypothetical protein